MWNRCSISQQVNKANSIPVANSRNIELKFDELNKQKNFLQNTFYYHPFFSNSSFSQLSNYQVNSNQIQQTQQLQQLQQHQDQEPHNLQQAHLNANQDQQNQKHDSDESQQPYDENANLRLLMEVAVGLWEEQQRNFDFGRN